MQKRWNTIITLVLALMMLVTSVCAEGTEAGTGEMPQAEADVTAAPTAEAEMPAVTPLPTEAATAEPELPQESPAPTVVPAMQETAAPTVVPAMQETAAPTVEPVVEALPERRGIWVAANADLKDYQTDEKAKASLLVMQMLLARGVADGAPIGVSMMEKKDLVAKTLITTPEEWATLVDLLKSSGFNSKRASGEQFRQLLQWLNEKATGGELGEADVWVLGSQPQGNLGSEGKQASEEFSNNADVTMQFLSFQRQDETLQKNSKWILEEIRARGMRNFDGDVFYYEDFLRDPLPTAMEIFGLNMQAYPNLQEGKQENGDFLWTHAGVDTLLLLETESGSVTAAAETVEGAQKAFPVVIELNEKQSMVLLRNAAPGTYRITGGVTNVKAAYNIPDAKLVLVGEEDAAAPMALYLEDHVFQVHFNVTQITAEDVHFQVLINGQEYALFQEGADAKLERAKVDDGVSMTVYVDAGEMPLAEGASGEGTLQFIARVGDFKVESPEYAYVVTDRPLAFSGDGLVEASYYANVPGQENQPLRLALEPYFSNLDRQVLAYQPDSDEYTLDSGVLTYTMEEELQPHAWQIQVTDGASAPLTLQVAIYPVDFMAQVDSWSAQISQTAYAGKLGVPTEITFTLPAEAAELYARVHQQYPDIPAALEDALRIEAVLTEPKMAPAGVVYPVVLTSQEDGSLLGSVLVDAFEERANADITFRAVMLDAPITGQLLPDCTIEVTNDSPELVEGITAELSVEAEIQGAPEQRVPLALSSIVLPDGQPLLPQAFVPEALFKDLVHMDGLTVMIKAEPASLVSLAEVLPDGGSMPIAPNEQGVWVLAPDLSKKNCELTFLDKGMVTISISASDGEMDSETNIHWTIDVKSPYDQMMMIIVIAAASLLVLVILVLIIRQIRKPSFARMNSYVCMHVHTGYSINAVFNSVPMHVYGKKETDLARLFIACQQPPMTSLPLDVLAEVTIQPRKNGYRLVVGKRAENLNVVVGDAAQNPLKPVNFEKDKLVCVYRDMSERLFFRIEQGNPQGGQPVDWN